MQTHRPGPPLKAGRQFGRGVYAVAQTRTLAPQGTADTLPRLGVTSTTVVQRISIEPATIGDCTKCAQLLVAQLAEHGVETSADRLVRVLEGVVADRARGFLLVAKDNGQIVGVAYVATILSAEHCGLVAWLEELYVTPDRRCRGVGTALLTGILERAREAGIVAVDLEIDAGHSRAASLFARFGFRPLDRSRWVRELKPG